MMPGKPKRFHRYPFSLYMKFETREDHEVKCIECDGYGKVRRSDDCDYIEGYKMAPWHKCGRCSGTGIGKKEDHKAEYKRLEEYYREKVADWKRLVKILKSIPKDDLEFLRRNWRR